uniref:hypothetical protein n=1 Tax=uncultured Polaribacter sp. TaxID=174711 RepID=UPI0026055B9D|nr:hypothetical protein [uncultured Polaribacter sp.]
MKKILFTVIFLMTLTTYSQEEKLEEGKEYDGWIYIEKSTQGNIYYKHFKENTIWFKFIYKKPKKHITFFQEEVIVESYIVLYKFDCDKKELGFQSSGYFTKEGLVDERQKNERMIKMKFPFPDTLEEFILNYYCNKIKKN